MLRSVTLSHVAGLDNVAARANVCAMTGLELKLRRTARRVKVTDLGRAMGTGHSRVSQIEAQAVVTQRTAARYLAALATFPEVIETPDRAEAI